VKAPLVAGLLAAALLSIAFPVEGVAQNRRRAAAPDSAAVEERAPAPMDAATRDSLANPPAYMREVFTYPRFSRVDPVAPPAVVTSAEAFTELHLTGIVYDAADPRNSAAIVRVGGDARNRRVVRAGDRVGQYTIVEVRRADVVVDVRLLGSVQRTVINRDPPTPAEAQPRSPARRGGN
jgi:hypothetical protein